MEVDRRVGSNPTLAHLTFPLQPTRKNMGQYFYIVNLDKNEKLHPHKFDDGLKMSELNNSLTALSMLLATGEGIEGRWAGDRIAVIGDYNANPELKTAFETSVDISEDVKAALRGRFPWLDWGGA